MTDHLNEDQEPYAGGPVPDPWATAAVDPPVDGANLNQTPEVEEFGLRAVQSGDPDGEDRPNGDPRTVGRPVGGGDRSPEVDVRGGEPTPEGPGTADRA